MAKGIGVIGLGAMGLPMAQRLAGQGFAVLAHDLDKTRREAARAAGIALADNAAGVCAGAETVILSLPHAAAVRAVLLDAGLAALPPRVIIDTSTSEAEISRALAAELAAQGHGFLDAPVSGGPAGAGSGGLSFMIGGEAQTVAAARPVLEALGRAILHVGPSGAGNVAKLVNNMLVACHMLTTAEGLRLAEAAGVSSEAALKVINAASGRSMLSEVHFPQWVLPGTDSGFSAGLMRKDLRLALELAEANGARLPLAELARVIWAAPDLPDQADFTRMGDPARPPFGGKP